jgi:hypothetical protein
MPKLTSIFLGVLGVWCATTSYVSDYSTDVDLNFWDFTKKKRQRRALQRPVLWLDLRSYSGHLTAGRWSDGPCGHQNGTLEKGLIRNCMNGTRRHFGQKKEKELKIGKSIELGEHQAFIHCHMDVAGPGSRTTSPLARCRKTTNLETCHREHVTAWRFAPTSVHSGYD